MDNKRGVIVDEESASRPAWIFDTDFRLPSKVCILAPGPNGKTHYADIPDDYTVLAVNKAVLIDAVEADAWLMNLADQAWFEAANAVFEGVRVFWREEPDSPDYNPAVEKRLSAAYTQNTYYFRIQRPGLDENTMPLFSITDMDHAILSGGTVSGAALQLAYHFDVREVLLCGVDMSGTTYWDGTVSEMEQWHGDVWHSAKAVDFLIKEVLSKKGIIVTTLSPTRLDVPYWDG